MSDPVGARIASGRDGEIFELGRARVLRRARDGRSLEREARIMTHVAGRGYPVPAVDGLRAGGTELVMERIDGPMMMDAMVRRPWRLPRYAAMLADLHDALHELEAPTWLPRFDDGDRVLHLDLHPMNVMLSARGPVVIDWANARTGAPVSDTALAYVLLTCPEMPAPRLVQTLARPARVALAGRFAHRYRGPAFDARLAFVAELKALDPHLSAREVAACRRLARRTRGAAG